MSQGKRFPLDEARDYAEVLKFMLEPACENIIIAGSIRRGKPMVGDVEIVALAKESQVTDLFGGQVNVGRTAIDFELDKLGSADLPDWQIDPRKQGEKVKRLRYIHTGLLADLYIVMDRRAWGAHVAIRTGPHPLSKEIVTKARVKGMHFANGFLLHDHFKRRTPCTPDCVGIIPLYQEIDVFETLEMPYLSPEQREERYGSGI